MASEKPSPILLDAVKASASKFKETRNLLDARAKELEALRAQLDAQRAELEKQTARLRAEREEFAKERDQVQASRASLDRDPNGVEAEREKVAAEEKRVGEWARVLNDREKAIKEAEDRVKRLEADMMAPMRESEAKIQALGEREE